MAEYIDTDFNHRDLWLTRLYYLILLGGGGFIFPFINLFYVRQGLTGTQVGLVVALNSLSALIAAPLWTEWSSKSSNPRAVLSLGLITSGLSFIWLSYQQTLIMIAIVSIIRGLTHAGLFPLSDAMALKVTGATRSGFGSVRVFGSGGWAVIVLLGGYLIEKQGVSAAFSSAAFTYVASALLLTLIHFPRHVQLNRPVANQGGLHAVTVAIRKTPALAGLVITLVVVGLGNIGVVNFENVYLDELGASESLIGVASMLSAVVEVPGMFWADRLVRKQGPDRILVLGLLLTGATRVLVIVFPGLPAILAQKALGGIAFSFYTVALIQYISRYSPADCTGTILAVMTVTLASLIGIVGAPLSGWLFDLIGAYWLYSIALLGYLIGCLSLKVANARQEALATQQTA
ncbi:MAG TPA: MFS transporter [Anaerolineaceae bacterium]|nr:MFS transporter [Anaerolineaceae bacterium]